MLCIDLSKASGSLGYAYTVQMRKETYFLLGQYYSVTLESGDCDMTVQVEKQILT